MISTTCHCGAVRISIPHAPESLTNRACSVSRRYGVLWAYYTEAEVQVAAAPGALEGYSWGRKSIRFVRCRTCGCITHWEPIVAGRGPRVGVNARNFEPEQLGPLRIRRLGGSDTETYLDP